MTSLEAIYKGIPRASKRQPNNVPTHAVLARYLASIDAAYDQVGLAGGNDERLCPGLPEGNDEGSFQVHTRSSSRDRRQYRYTSFVASSPDAEVIFEGDVDTYFGAVTESNFRAQSPDNPLREFGLTKKSWGVLAGFIMEQAGAGLFVPVEVKLGTLPIPSKIRH